MEGHLMSRTVREMARGLTEKIFAGTNGRILGTSTVAQLPPESQLADLTLERWLKLRQEFLHPPMYVAPTAEAMALQSTLTPGVHAWAVGFRIVEVQPTPIHSQVRTHKRKRINKKWLKRYGVKQIGWNYFLEGQLLVDENHNVVYCHPETAQNLRHEMAKPRVTCQHCKHTWVVASERSSQSQSAMPRVGSESSMMMVAPGDGPAGGEHDCPKCGAVNRVCRMMGGGWDVVLISVPDTQNSIRSRAN